MVIPTSLDPLMQVLLANEFIYIYISLSGFFRNYSTDLSFAKVGLETKNYLTRSCTLLFNFQGDTETTEVEVGFLIF